MEQLSLLLPTAFNSCRRSDGLLIAVINGVSGFDIQTRLVGHSAYRNRLSHGIDPLASFGCLFVNFNKRIIDRRLSDNNSH